MNYREMQITDYQGAISLWQESEGVKLREADSLAGIQKYLDRNPGLSFIAEESGTVYGTILAGHDGKRGYIQHLAVAESKRRLGVASQLLTLSLEALAKEGILKSHIHILKDNELAKQFWQRHGWVERTDIKVY